MDNQVKYTVTLQDMVSGKLNSMDSNAKTFEKTLGRIGGALAATFAIGKIIDFGKSVFDAGTTIENATIGLTTLLGDAGEAAQVVKNTMKDAAATPFDFKGLLAANQALISAGIGAERAREDVLNLSNAVAATGGGNDELNRMVLNLQQIKNVGFASAQDVKQFGMAKINIYTALEKAGIKYTKGEKISYEQITLALKKAHDEGGIYYNGLENMANSSAVKASNIGDVIFQSYAAIFQELKPYIDGVLGFIVDGLARIQPYIGPVIEIIVDSIKTVYEFLKPLIPPIMNLFNKIWEGWKKMIESLSQFSGEGVSLLTYLRDGLGFLIDVLAVLYEGVYNFIAGVVDVIHTIYVILDKLGVIWLIGKTFQLVWSIIKALGLAIKDIYDTEIKPIVDKIIWAYDKLKDLLGIKDKKLNFTISAKKEEEETPGKDKKTKGLNDFKPTSPTDNTKVKTPGGAKGQSITTINIRIDSLVKSFTVSTTNLTESADLIQEKVAMALTAAINDSQIIK